jgi:ubiquinone/menaquinone biosynthesis C-methylase UbiE
MVVACSRTTKATAAPASAQAQTEPQARPTSTPYAGDLSIFESDGRDKRLQIDRVMKLLKMGKGSSVADIGAGSGWFTVRAAKKVGPTGVVYAEDINPQATKYIDDRAKKESLGNIRTVLGVPDDPKLAPGSVDAVMMLKVYHEIAQPVRFAENLRGALKPGALVGIIDRNGDGSGTDHGLPQTVAEREMDEAGFRKVAKYDFTKGDGQDYFLIFAVK